MALIPVKSEGAKRLSRFCSVAAGIIAAIWSFNHNGGYSELEVFVIAVVVGLIAFIGARFLVLGIAWVIEGFKRPPSN